MKQIPTLLGRISLFFFLIKGAICFADPVLQNKNFAFDTGVGIPQLIGVNLSYVGWTPLSIGLGFGSAPINSLISRQVTLNPIPVSLPSISDSYSLYPSASFQVYSFSAFIKYFLGDSGWMAELLYTSLTLNASFQADLKDETTGGISSNVVSGSAQLTQPILGLALGYEFSFFSNFFASFALGAGYLFPPSYSFSIGGTASAALGALPSADETSFDSAKSQIQSSFDSAVAAYRSALKFIPFLLINVGVAF